MDGVGGAGRSTGALPGRRRARAQAGFVLRAAGAEEAAAALPALPAAESLLAVQLLADRPAAAAERHVNVMIDDLMGLQRALLSDDATGCRAILDRLAAFRASLPGAGTDAALAEILDSVALRAEIELLRRGRDPRQPPRGA